jgi:hypothetical protein
VGQLVRVSFSQTLVSLLPAGTLAETRAVYEAPYRDGYWQKRQVLGTPHKTEIYGIFRTFGADKNQKSAVINNLRDLKHSTLRLFLKTIQVVDWNRLVGSFSFETAPKVRKSRFEYSVTTAF